MPLTKLAFPPTNTLSGPYCKRKMGEEERPKLPSDVLYLARAVLLLLLQLKDTVSFLQWKPQDVVPGVSVPVAGLQPRAPTLRFWLNTGHLLQTRFAVRPRHLVTRSSEWCLPWEGCTDLASSACGCLAKSAHWLMSAVSRVLQRYREGLWGQTLAYICCGFYYHH